MGLPFENECILEMSRGKEDRRRIGDSGIRRKSEVRGF